MDQFVSSDPHAFPRPIYGRLAAERAFHLLAEPLQFDRLRMPYSLLVIGY